MSTYQYRCPNHGLIDVVLPFGTPTSNQVCPSCDSAMTRVFTAPMLGFGPAGVIAAIDRTLASAETPAVVARPAITGTRSAATPANPAWRRLPRP